MSHRPTHMITRSILIVVCITVVWSSLMVQPVSAMPVVRTDPTEVLLDQTNKVQDRVGKALLATGLSGLMNAASYFMRKLAYDTAKYVASGGRGQSALVFEDGFDKYLSRTADAAVGEIIDELSDLTGLNLCAIPDPQFNLFLTIGIRGMYADGPPTAEGCSWTDFRDAWDRESWQERFEQYGDQFDESLDQYLTGEFLRTNTVEQSDFGIAFGAIAQVDRLVAQRREAATLDRIEGQGFQSVRSLISGDVRTPAQIVQEETTAATAKGNTNLTTAQIAGIYGSGALQILPQAASVFLNTLTSDLLQQLLTRGLLPERSGSGNIATDAFAGPGANRRNAAEQAFNFLFTSLPSRQLSSYDDDLINEFATCPEYPGVYNCVMDSGLQQALDRARIGDAMTIQEAMDARPPLLNPNWPLIPPDRPQDNESPDCYLGSYCYSNVQKLRKARILPLGFEIATTLGDPDNPSAVTLGQVVNGYNDCAIGPNGENVRDAAHPYCNLIDPNWIIKMPEAICEAIVHSPVLTAPSVAQRGQECADLATCVAYDSDGNCTSYGYCLQEENTWHMPGQSCPAEYATCQSYIQQSTGAAVSYLSRTVDVGMCGPNNVGCLAYSLIKNTSGDWVQTTAVSAVLPNQAAPDTLSTLKQTTGLNQGLHLNSRINRPEFTCSPDDAGCTQLRIANIVLDGDLVTDAYPAGGDDIALQLAPDYLTCYDRDLDITNGIQWPTTVAEAITAGGSNAACDLYAPACAPTEVGCKLWEPIGGGTSVPGKIGTGSCSLECVGYDTFRQIETVFEPELDPLYFVPSQAATCAAQYVGCSEFTNIESLSQGGEQRAYFTELRYCELPEGNNQKTFYSWEGSEVEGFVLRVHELAQYQAVDADRTYYTGLTYDGVDNTALKTELFGIGAPKYAARTKAELAELYTSCNATTYALRISDPLAEGAAPTTCRELYDDTGATYYRNIDQIVTVSTACVDFRKTTTVLSMNPDITVQSTCTDRGGFWSDSTTAVQDLDGDGVADTETGCFVCRGGGTYRDGACIYATIPSESRECPATQNECRAYVGNTGTNIRRLQLGTFEGASTDSWTGGTVSTESPFANQYSLRIAGSATRLIGPNELNTGTTEASYELRFWARGIPQSVSASLGSAEFGSVGIGDVWRSYTIGPITATDLDISVTNTLRISGAGTNQFFIDNVEIVRNSGYLYLQKNSWQRQTTLDGQVVTLNAPLSCDSTPLDAFAGEALGCSLYQNANNPAEQRAVTNFESLCREDAIGCTAVYDTQNTVGDDASAELEHWYNARCSLGAPITVTGSALPLLSRPAAGVNTGGTCTVYSYTGTPATDTQQVLGSCTIRPGDTYCDIPRIVVPDHRFTFNGTAQYSALYAALVSPSTYIVAEDTPIDAPIFVANQREYQCRTIGCTELGQELQTLSDASSADSYEYNAVYLRLRPETFTDTSGGREPVLCTADTVGCDAFGSNNSVQYFKDPRVTGNSLCEYRDNVRVDGEILSGWFQRGVGRCADTTANICSSNDQCAAGVSCDMNVPVACDEDYITLENEYGLWSNSSPQYAGFVGVCEPQFNGCTEFVDRGATSITNPDGDAYYAIMNDQLTARVDECNGQVGLKDGCVLFDQTNVPNKRYNTAATYAASENNPSDKFGLVDPITTGAASAIDANIILKVDRDRQCAEWLECRLSRPEIDENGQTRDVCIMYDVCLEADSSGGCAVWSDNIGTGYCSVDPSVSCTDSADCAGRGSCVFQSTLTVDSYASRDTSWYGRDYSGYSVLGMRPYANIEPIVFDADPFKQYLAYVMPESLFDEQPTLGCSDDDGSLGELERCGFSGEGVCYTGQCIAPISGRIDDSVTPTLDRIGTGGSATGPDGVFGVEDRLEPTNAIEYRKVMASLVGSTCKAPPEADAPYPATVLATISSALSTLGTGDSAVARYATELPGNSNRKSGFTAANVYQDPFNITALAPYLPDNPFISSCIYTKVGYDAGITDYIPINQPRLSGVCTGSTPVRGNPCNPTGPNTCGESGLCSPVNTVQTHIGLEGFCLQKDLSRPINGGSDYACLVWLPMQLSASRIDVYNNAIEAGYYPVPEYDAPTMTSPNPRIAATEASGGALYCTESTDFERPINDVKDEIIIRTASGGTTLGTRQIDLSIDSYYGISSQVRYEDGGSFGGIDVLDRVVTPFCSPSDNILNVNRCLAIATGRDGFDVDDDTNATLADEDISNFSSDRFAYFKDNINSACNGHDGECSGAHQCDNAFFTSNPGSASDALDVGFGSFACGGDQGDGDRSRAANRAAARSSCMFSDGDSRTKPGAFQRFVCLSQDQQESEGYIPADMLMKFWGWSYISGGEQFNTQLLRIELAEDATNNTVWSSKESGSSGKTFGFVYTGDSINKVFALLPETKSVSTPGNTSGNIFMHPPRRWSRIDTDDALLGRVFPYLGTNRTPSFGSWETQPSDAFNFSGPGARGIITDAYSPEYNRSHTDLVQVQYEYESNMTLNQIESVTFVPMRVPGGHAGGDDGSAPTFSPSYFTRDLTIPVAQLLTESQFIVLPAARAGRTHSNGGRMEFPDTQENDVAKVVAQLFTRGNQSYADCGGIQFSCNYGETSDQFGERNIIATRITMIYTSGEDTRFDGVAESNNPFNPTLCGSDTQDWFAIGLDFNSNGEFLGYISRNCIQSSYGRGYQLATYATLRNSCTEFMQVYDDTELYAGHTNKAKTNLVWRGLTSPEIQVLFRPYGSLPFNGDFVSNTARTDVVLAYEGGRVQRNINTYFNLVHAVSYKYFEIGGVDSTPRDAISRVISSTYLPPQLYATNPATCKTRSAGAIAAQAATAQAASTSTVGALGTGCTAGPVNTFTINGMTGQLGLDFDGTGAPSDEDDNGDGEWDGLLGFDTYPITLQFFAFADHDRMPIRQVKVDFDDGSPIAGGKMGYYKNAKPYCAPAIGECGDTQLSCTDSTDCRLAGLTGPDAVCGAAESNFGNQTRACTTNFFEYNYVYRCYESDARGSGVTIGDLPPALQARALRYPNVTSETPVCAYKPRVQVTDNWEWCNATDSGDAAVRTTGGFGISNCGSPDDATIYWTSFGEAASRDTLDRYIYVIPKIDR